MKIKEKIMSIFQSFKKSFAKFPLTMITIIFITLLCAICLDTSIWDKKIFLYILEFCMIFAVESFFIEAYGKIRNKLKIVIYCISVLISSIFVFLLNTKLPPNQEFNLIRIFISYIVILLTMTLYFLYKNSKKSVEEYVIKVFSNLVKTGLTYLVLSIGIAAITAVFIYLILSNSIEYMLVLRLEIVLFGIYFVPNVIYSFENVENEVTSFFKGLIKYVLGGLIFAAFIIIYMYMVKIFVLWNIPSNQIFRILTLLFVFALPVWTMVHYYNNENNAWQKIYKKMPLLFAPFILLQIYSIGVRVLENGITLIRYMGLLFVIFEIIYLLLYVLKKRKIENIILVFDVLFIICVLVPGINMFSISNLSQANRLKVYTQKTELTTKEKEQAYSAYRYLSTSENGDKYINKILSEEQKEEIQKMKENKLYFKTNNVEYICASSEWNEIDVKDYSKICKVHCSKFALDKSVDEAFENLNIFEGKSIDLRNTILDYIYEHEKNENDFMYYFKENNTIILEDGSELIIEYLDISYNKDTKEITRYEINGILLLK